MLCTVCGTKADPIKHSPGTSLTEMSLFVLSIILGVAGFYITIGIRLLLGIALAIGSVICFLFFIGYIIWRRSATKTVCPACLSPAIIPIDSPEAIRLMNR